MQHVVIIVADECFSLSWGRVPGCTAVEISPAVSSPTVDGAVILQTCASSGRLESGAEDARSPNALRDQSAYATREASGLRLIYRRFGFAGDANKLWRVSTS